MRVSLTDDVLPEYLPGPPDHILMLGVIALNYGQLENMFRHVFSAVTRMNDIQVAAIFQRIPNNIRQTVLSEVMAQTTLPDQLKDRVKYFTDGFKICAENRHDLMHSHSGGVFTSKSKGTRGLLFSKHSRAGNEFVCAPDLQELRTVADEIHDYMNFGFHVSGDIKHWADCRDHDDEESFWRVPLKDKPRAPTALRWHSPESVLIQPSPPESSPA
jgi:hypothetical protein